MILRVKKLNPLALLPKYQTIGASGIDLCATEKITLLPQEYKSISTGIAIEIPYGFEGQIRPRSGLAVEYGIGVLNSPGTIDADYRGEIKVILFNFGKLPLKIKIGMRIAQLVIAKTYKVTIRESKLSKTKRDKGGFGSTGK
ncbi:MAG: dUTP diphosphatase [Candidatus Stahlbacteria bacterium]|nr:dUTP diphosphatase [Candidatus Stahlbacteria bacterium]